MKHFIYTLCFTFGFIFMVMIIGARHVIWESIFASGVVFVESHVVKVVPFRKINLKYINNKYNYCFSYPKEFKIDEDSVDADNVNILGSDLLISVQAFENVADTNILEFVDFINLSIVGELAEENKGNSDKSIVIMHDYENPNSKAIFWETGNSQLLLTISGKGYDEFMEGNNFIDDFHLNIENFKICN